LQQISKHYEDEADYDVTGSNAADRLFKEQHNNN
jgi:hypothetical protein